MKRSVKILLVEDNPQDAELTIRALRGQGLTDDLLHLKDGQEALDFLFATGEHFERDETDLPAVVFLDLKLPKIDGIEVLEQIRSNSATQLLPVVMFTSSGQECDLVDAYRLGVNSYLVKPVDFETFTNLVIETGNYWIRHNECPRLDQPT